MFKLQRHHACGMRPMLTCCSALYAGHAFVLQYLLAWGCPLALVEALQACPTSSRRVLLALGWLVAHMRLLEHALDALSLPPALRTMLPPYPQACCHKVSES